MLFGCSQQEGAINDNWENDVNLIENVNMLTTNFTNGDHYDHEVAESYDDLISDMKSLEVDVEDETIQNYREGIVGHAQQLEKAFNEEDKEKIKEHVQSLNEIRKEYEKYLDEALN